jgi:hypothetical protein
MKGKSDRIEFVVKYLQDKFGSENIPVRDHWEADFDAIGLTDKTGTFLAYISTISDREDDYYLALENPPVDDDFPYSPAGDFDKITLPVLEQLIAAHLHLND